MKNILESRIQQIKILLKGGQYQNEVEHWFEIGKEILLSSQNIKKCPLCNSDLSNNYNNLLHDFDFYFNKEYERAIADLKLMKSYLDQEKRHYDTNKENLNKIKNFLKKYNMLEQDISDISFDELELQLLFTLIDDKIKNLQSGLSNNLEEMLDVLEKNIINYNQVVMSFHNQFIAQKDKITSKFSISEKIKHDIVQSYKNIVLKEYDENMGDGLQQYKKNQEELSLIDIEDPENKNGLLYWTNARTSELEKLKVEARGTQNYLKLMGINHFTIDMEGDNLLVHYNDGTKSNSLKNSLSDGEKSALAFSFFLSKWDNEIANHLEKEQQAIIVIDDPITSLDENRLYDVAELIHSKFNKNSKNRIVNQLILLSHNFLFLKIINKFYKHTVQLLLAQNELRKLPNELINFESPYFYMLRDIIDYYNADIEVQNQKYEQVKNYFPNYMRRVLETFFSFKYAIISSSNNSYTYGLKEFLSPEKNKKLSETLSNSITKFYPKLERIKKISDMNSHGVIEFVECINHIPSKEELDAIIKDLLDIMKEIDDVHLNEVNNEQSTG